MAVHSPAFEDTKDLMHRQLEECRRLLSDPEVIKALQSTSYTVRDQYLRTKILLDYHDE
jgi:hypothetical protein